MMGTSNTAYWAARYIDRFGMKLVPLRGKIPIGEGWNSDANLIDTPQAAHKYWTRNPRDNVGMCLEPSGFGSLDADYEEGARIVLKTEGINLNDLISTTPTIVGRASRLEFLVPPGVILARKAVTWPPKAKGEKPVTVLELRAGRVQDVLPPSIHPATNKPYFWLTPPRNGFPVLPDNLLRLWQDFDAFRHRARNLCPWAEPEPEPAVREPRPLRQRTGPSVIAEFNNAHDVVSILESHGYSRAGKNRWQSPNGHNLAGVILLRDGQKIKCYHASDPLGDEKAHDAFDVYRVLEHGGDFRAAVKAAAQALGLNRDRERAA